MEMRPFAWATGSLSLVMLALAAALLLGEESNVPPPRDESGAIAAAAPELQPAADPDRRAEGTNDEMAPAPETPASATPLSRAPPPVAPAPPPVVEAPPAVRPPPAAEQTQPPAAPRPAPRRPAVVDHHPDHRYDGVLTVAEIGRLKRSLRLSPDQEPYWPPVASVLREVGRHQMMQVDAGQRPSFDLPGDLSSRLYSAAMPLLGVLREDQKEVVRRHARALGLGAAASFI